MLCNGNHILRGKHLMILMKIRSIDIFLDRRLLSIVKLFNIFIYIYMPTRYRPRSRSRSRCRTCTQCSMHNAPENCHFISPIRSLDKNSLLEQRLRREHTEYKTLEEEVESLKPFCDSGTSKSKCQTIINKLIRISNLRNRWMIQYLDPKCYSCDRNQRNHKGKILSINREIENLEDMLEYLPDTPPTQPKPTKRKKLTPKNPSLYNSIYEGIYMSDSDSSPETTPTPNTPPESKAKGKTKTKKKRQSKTKKKRQSKTKKKR